MNELILRLKELFPESMHSRIRLTGGMVRDILLGLQCQDIDLAAAVSPSELTPIGFRLVESKSTPNIYFLYHRELGKVEVTRLSSMEELSEDLQRRDFTINAMAMTMDGEVIDIHNGRQDLEKKVLRTCSETSLSDDPVRIFRALRFETQGWRLDRDAEQAIFSREWDDGFRDIPVERFSQEMLKALASADPCRFFERMVELKVGKSFLPEIFLMLQVPAGPIEHHPEGDLFTHSMQSLERMSRLSRDPKARFCALFHDLGKLSTPEDQYPKHHGHDAAGALAAEGFCKRLRLPAALQRALQATSRLHNSANRWHELRDSTRIKMASSAIKAGIDAILPQVVAADCGGAMPGWEETLRVAALNLSQLGMDPGLFQNPQYSVEQCQQMILQKRVQELRKTKAFNRDEGDAGDKS